MKRKNLEASLNNNKILNEHNYDLLNNITRDEQSYRTLIKNLARTRRGLHHILDTRPDLYGVVKPQFDSLNDLIDALLPDNYSRVKDPLYY